MKFTAALLALAGALFAQDHAMLPITKLTPGATDPRVTEITAHNTVCKVGYTSTVRSVSSATKRAVMKAYGLPVSDLHLVEIDHLISLEIGGSNDAKNLWPQYYQAAAGQRDYLGARDKDVVENWLKRQVCSGAMTLKVAQEAIKTWPEWYARIKGAR